MFLGACLDAGLKKSVLDHVVKTLGLSKVHLGFKKESRGEIRGTRLVIHIPSKSGERNLRDILRLLEKAKLSAFVRRNAKEIFQTLAEVEGKVHGISPNKVHFHEVGAIDSLIDIVGACAAVEALNIREFYASAIPMGSGFQKSSHGQIPIPGPATMELLKGIPVTLDSRKWEVITPTGAVLLKQFCKNYGTIPEMAVQSVGYGVGTKNDPTYPNLLRILIGETTSARGVDEVDCINILETNIDDMNPQFLSYIFDVLLGAGALDVYLTPIQMKDSRSGVKLSMICHPKDQSRLADLIFSQTTTLGVRIFKTDRIKLKREIVQVKTEFGAVPVKLGYRNGKISSLSPEYKILKQLADKSGRPIKEIYFKALSEAQRKFLGKQ